MTNSEIYTSIVNTIWSEESASLQAQMLKEFSNSIRKCSSEYLVASKAFLVYYNNLFIDAMTQANLNMNYTAGLYSATGQCFFANRLVIPLYGFNNQVYGFVGYDNGNDCLTQEDKLNLVPYLYMSSDFFSKERFWFMTREEYIKAHNDNYICIVDGIFDKIALQSRGYNAVSLLGSHLSKYHKDYLRYIKNWIVFSDSDSAGNTLYTYCKSINPNTVQIQVGGAKDIDERLRDEENADKILSNLFSSLQKECYVFSHSLEEFAF